MKHALLPNVAQQASVVSLRHRYVLVINSKTAGTTLKTIAAQIEGEPLAMRDRAGRGDAAQRTENWLRTPTLADLPDRWLREVFIGQTFFRFTTVRNPIARCWSAWVDKVVGKHPLFVATFGRESWFPWDVVDGSGLISRFAAFVDALAREDGLIGADRHWAPQCLVLQWGAFPYDFVGKTEEFDTVISQWEAATGLDIAPVAKRIGRRNATALEFPGSLLAARTRQQLVSLYARDFDVLEYDREHCFSEVEPARWCEQAHGLLRDVGSRREAPSGRGGQMIWRGMRVGGARLSRLLASHSYEWRS